MRVWFVGVLWLAVAVSAVDDLAFLANQYHWSTRLLDKAQPLQHHREEHITAITQLKNEIASLNAKLRVEAEKLNSLTAERAQLKRSLGLLWIFKANERLQVMAANLAVQDQARVVENVRENINFHWAKVKPHFGVFSQLLLDDLLLFFPYAIGMLVEFIMGFFEMGLIAFIIGGPALIIFSMLAISLFGSFFGFVVGTPMILACMLWIFHLPFLIIEYDPSLTDFLVVYFPSTLVLLTITFLFLRWSTGSRTVQVVAQTRPHLE